MIEREGFITQHTYMIDLGLYETVGIASENKITVKDGRIYYYTLSQVIDTEEIKIKRSISLDFWLALGTCW